MNFDWITEHLNVFGVFLFISVAYFQISKRAKHQKIAIKNLEKSIKTRLNEPLTLHPEVNPALCAGCGACTKVCPEGDILQMINHKAVLVSPTKCVGHGECEVACPTQAITLVFGTKLRGMDIPRISKDYETNIPGLYIAGELGGMGLIRNAVKQGAMAAEHALNHLKPTQARDVVDLLVIGAGPAGLSASLMAITQKKSYRCIEQGSFGGTVYQFPRQKVVMTYPAVLPGVGSMKFPNNKASKEELLEYWNAVRRKTGLKIEENTRFEGLTPQGDSFLVKTNQGDIVAKKVLLALGVRGSPRKLGLANEELPKVTYNLIDPEQYRDRDVAVVGGGNAGVEAAQYLGKPEYGNRVHLLVRGASFDRCNEENQRIIQKMANDGLVRIHYETSVKEIFEDKITLDRKSKGPSELPNQFLFVFAGAESPHKYLMTLGIKIETKFGEALR